MEGGGWRGVNNHNHSPRVEGGGWRGVNNHNHSPRVEGGGVLITTIIV